MKTLAVVLLTFVAVVAIAAPLTLNSLSVDTKKQTVCGVGLGMTKTQVKAELGKRKLNYSFGQKFDATTKSMKPDENIIEVQSKGDKIIYSISFQNDKVRYIEILFSDYSEKTAKEFAKKLWKPKKGTSKW